MLQNLRRLLTNTKFLTAMGFFFAAWFGTWFAASLSASLVNFLSLGALGALLIGTVGFFVGGFIGAGLYIQGLKDFAQWPMEEVTTAVSFRPSILWKDSVFALRKFDWELLKYVSQVLLDKWLPQINNTLKIEAPAPTNQSWYSISSVVHNLFQKAKNVGNEIIDENLAPEATRSGICSALHTVCFLLTHLSTLNQLPKTERKELIQNENIRYQTDTFVTSLRFTKTGFFETTGSVLYDEFRHFRNRTP